MTEILARTVLSDVKAAFTCTPAFSFAVTVVGHGIKFLSSSIFPARFLIFSEVIVHIQFLINMVGFWQRKHHARIACETH